jgi:putative mRNA 3-end processing factor
MRQRTNVAGWDVTLHDAGHCLGAAMVHVEGANVLYTGDFNTTAGFTTAGAKPVECDTLVMESTYGDPRFTLPPRELALASLEAWLDRTLPNAGAAIGAYQLGRAQELVALLNRRGHAPAVTPDILALCDIYRKHGVDLRYRAATPDELYGSPEPGQAMIVPRNALARGEPFAAHMAEAGAKAAYVSGWCSLYSYFDKYAIDAQFALTDHATFDQLLSFAQACKPKRVYTCMGKSEQLAREVARTLGVPAKALG